MAATHGTQFLETGNMLADCLSRIGDANFTDCDCAHKGKDLEVHNSRNYHLFPILKTLQTNYP